MTKEKRLGRGLAALLGEPTPAPQPEGQEAPAAEDHGEHAGEHAGPPMPGEEPVGKGEMVLLNVYEIDENPFQPRREFSESEIASLSESLKEHDMIQPVVVRRVGERYQLISGERRLRAAIQAGWAQVPARVRVADDRLVAELAIVENLQRKDLNPIEKALAFQRYLQQHDCKQEDLARRIKADRSTIANLMRLLELPQAVLDALRAEKITAGHARALLPLGDEPDQIAFCNRIQQEGLSVRATESAVQEKIAAEDTEPLAVAGSTEEARKKPAGKSEQVAALEQELRMALGTKVDIKQTAKGKGKITIHFAGHEEFDRIRAQLNDWQRPQSAAG